jgi:tetratricopeptide (TPR) repeat protein
MPGLKEHRSLRGLALFAFLAVAPCGFCVLLPAQTPAHAPDQGQVSPPAAPVPAPTRQASIFPAAAPTPEQLGDSLSAHRRYQEAISAYGKATEFTPALWNKMGIAYQMMFNQKDAMRCYDNSRKLDPHNAQVLNNLATVYESMKEYGKAERLYRKAVKIDPRSALILRNLGSNLLTQRKYSKGWAVYQEALAIDPGIFEDRAGVTLDNPSTTQQRGAMHYYMARSCVTAGHSDCAIQNLRLALNEGFTNAKKIAADSSFASLRQLSAFKELIASESAH